VMQPLLVVLALGYYRSVTGAEHPEYRCAGTTTANDVASHLAVDMTGKTVFLTGGDSGIGLATAMAVATTNASLVIASYSPSTAGAAAAAAITNATGNGKVTVLPIDLSSLASVRTCAALFLASYSAVDVLINDAGIDHNPTSLAPLTDDGYERVFQVNYLGHFLLTRLLGVALSASGRVINVASLAHKDACSWAAAPDNCTDIGEQPPPVRAAGNNTEGAPISNYGLTKFLQVFHAAELIARSEARLAFSLHPGFVDTPMTRELSPETRKEWCAMQTHCPLTSDEGASTVAYLALAPAASLRNGAYYQQCRPAMHARWDQASQRELFDLSLQWSGASSAEQAAEA